MKEKPNYYAILTAEVRYDKELSDKAKLLYAEITALSGASGECWATDTYFSKLYSCTRETINRNISLLSDRGYITIRREKLTRCIKINGEHHVAAPVVKPEKKEVKAEYSAVAYYLNTFKRFFPPAEGQAYKGPVNFSGARDGKLLKGLLTKISREEYEALLPMYFEMTEKWIKDHGYDVARFIEKVFILRESRKAVVEQAIVENKADEFNDDTLTINGVTYKHREDYELKKNIMKKKKGE